jgi:hypothetical protein
MSDYQELSKMSITELKQLLSCVNQDIKSIKKAEKIAADNQPSEYEICNTLSAKFNKNINIESVENAKLKADIQIQKDILDYLNNGGHIITRVSRKKIKPLSVISYHKVSL